MFKTNRFFIALFLFPYVFSGVHAANMELNRLMNEKNKKMAQLEQCAKKVNGFKIAGVSTLGLTAAGVAGNVMLHKKSDELTKQITSTQKNIQSEKEKKTKLESDIETTQAARTKCLSDNTKEWKDGKCVARSTTTTETTAGATANDKNAGAQSSVKPKIGDNCTKQEIKDMNETFMESGVWKEFPIGVSKCTKDGTDVDCICSATACVNNIEPINIGSGAMACSVANIGDTCSAAQINDAKVETAVFVQGNAGKSTKKCKKDNDIIDCVCSATACAGDRYELLQGDNGISKCGEKFDWSPLLNKKKYDGIDLQRFCTLRSKNDLNGKIYSENTNELKQEVNIGGGIGYWCVAFGGKFNVKELDAGAGYEYSCELEGSNDYNECMKGPSGNSENSKSETNQVLSDSKSLLNKYKEYKIQCDDTKDSFEFVRDVDGIDNIIDELEEKCEKYNGNASTKNETKSIGGINVKVKILTCKGAKACDKK